MKKSAQRTVSLQQKREESATLKEVAATVSERQHTVSSLEFPEVKHCLAIHGKAHKITIQFDEGRIDVEGDWDEAAQEFMKKCAEIVNFKLSK